MAPLIALIAAIVAMAYFYTIDTSTTVDTLQSWTCRWKDVYMASPPHFGALCKESQTGLYLSILLIPLEAITLGVAAYQAGLERSINSAVEGGGDKASRATPSPVLSGEEEEK